MGDAKWEFLEYSGLKRPQSKFMVKKGTDSKVAFAILS